MGLNDVRFRMSEEGFEVLKKFSNEYIEEQNEITGLDLGNILEDPDIFIQENGMIYFGWDQVPWNPGLFYYDIDSVMDGLEYLKEHGYSYAYARIGEDIDDIEQRLYNNDESRLDNIEIIKRKFTK